MTKSRSRRSTPARSTTRGVSQALSTRARNALGHKDWLGALRAVERIARQPRLTPGERRTVLLVTRRVYAQAGAAYRRGDKRLAWQLARAVRRIPGPYSARAAALDRLVQIDLRSQTRKGRSTSQPKKARSVRAGTKRAAPPRRTPTMAGVGRGGWDGEDQSEGELDDKAGGTPTASRPSRRSPRRAARTGRRPVVVRGRGRPGGGSREGKAAEGSAESGSGQVVVRRNPHMDLSVPEPIPAGSAFAVDVWADARDAS
jgi:hypothetical protein